MGNYIGRQIRRNNITFIHYYVILCWNMSWPAKIAFAKIAQVHIMESLLHQPANYRDPYNFQCSPILVIHYANA